MNAAEFRRHFPIFQDGVHFASCSEGALSDRVMVAMSEFMTSWRVYAAPWEQWMAEVDKARQQFAALIHADARDIAVVSCASEAAFQVASSLDYTGGRPAIVTNDLEFPSVAHVWRAQEQRGAVTRFVSQQNGVIGAHDYGKMIDDTVGLVSVPLVAYANGLHFPVRAVADLAHQAGARVAVDAYQGAGVIPIDVHELGCDYLFGGALKYLLGAPGIAFLWIKPGLESDRDPILTGWFGRREPFSFMPQVLDYHESARRFQTGTPAVPAAYAAAAGLSLINELAPTEVWQHVSDLASHAEQALANQGWEFYSPTDPAYRGPQVTIRTDDAEAIAAFLARQRIFVSPRGSAVRISLHYYNNHEDIERVAAALDAYRRQTC